KLLDQNHILCGTFGLFALQDIPPDTWIMDYIGIVNLDTDIPDTNDYCVHFYGTLSIEAETAGNTARYINDFRNISDRPNVAFDTYLSPRGPRVGVFSLSREIKAGQELLCTYGNLFWKSRGIKSNVPDWHDDW
ncbi:hypothetical protein EDD86DRAFT_177595, partial [Gorgonomyces haynaldii]